MAKTMKKSSSKRSAKKTPGASRSGESAENTKTGGTSSKSKETKAKSKDKAKELKSKETKAKDSKIKDAKSKDSKTKEPKTTKSKDSKTKDAKAEPKAKGKEPKGKEAKGKDAKGKDKDEGGKRKLGLRGAAPWAARHAAKHAAEARARAAEPAPPGSARATIRVPEGAEEIKAKISELHNQTTKIRTLRKRMERGFFEIGEILAEIQEQDLFQAKGYGSFEAFLEREMDLGKQTSLKLVKISKVFQKEAALDYGMDKCLLALAALEGEAAPKAAPSTPGPMAPLPLPLKPPMRVAGS